MAVQVPVCIAYSAKYTTTSGTMYGQSLAVCTRRSPQAMSSALCCLLAAKSPSAQTTDQPISLQHSRHQQVCLQHLQAQRDSESSTVFAIHA